MKIDLAYSSHSVFCRVIRLCGDNMKITRRLKDTALKAVGDEMRGLCAACWLKGYEAGWKAHLPWVMRHNKCLWEVGYYHSDRKWYKYKTFKSPRDAEYTVNRLNGGM